MIFLPSSFRPPFFSDKTIGIFLFLAFLRSFLEALAVSAPSPPCRRLALDLHFLAPRFLFLVRGEEFSSESKREDSLLGKSISFAG